MRAPLSEAELERYSRALVLPEWSEAAQLALHDASVGVIGAGALGAPVALYLAAAGVGRLGMVDPDSVELSNLQRQLLHFTPDIGVPKAHSAAAKLRFLNPEIVVDAYQAELSEQNATVLLGEFDLVVDCSDSFTTRYAVNQGCCTLRKPLIEGGATGFSGIVFPVVPGETACYRCAFPQPPRDQASCAEAGILGPAAGMVGSLMALQALAHLALLPLALRGTFLEIDLAAPAITRVAVARRPDCDTCGALG